MVQVTWTGGSGPVAVTILDSALQQVPTTSANVLAGDRSVTVATSVIAAQTIIVSIRNDGATPITANFVAGFLPPS
jgi:hypothetical protein